MSRARTAKTGFKTVVAKLRADQQTQVIPTTFLALSPDKIEFDKDSADLLCGLFHIMWADMPRPSTYSLKLEDLLSISGEYLGSRLECAHPKKMSFDV